MIKRFVIFILEIIQAKRLRKALQMANWTPLEIEMLYKKGIHPEFVNESIHTKLIKVIRGGSVIQDRIIDCDAQPVLSDDLKVIRHVKSGQFHWDSSKIELYFSQIQKDGQSIDAKQLWEELKDKKVLNVNFLDYLLAHPWLIPKEWEGYFIVFLGTTFERGGSGVPLVYYLVGGLGARGDQWAKRTFMLENGLRSDSPVVVCK